MEHLLTKKCSCYIVKTQNNSTEYNFVLKTDLSTFLTHFKEAHQRVGTVCSW